MTSPLARIRVSPGTLTAVAALAIVVVVFGPHLRGEFVWDDYYLVEKNPLLASPEGWRALLTTDLWQGAGFDGSRLYHPLPMLSLWAQVRASGYSLVAMRLVNVAVHLANVWLFYRLLVRASVRPIVACALSLLFAVHPLAVEPVMWLTGRHDSIAVLLGLAGLHAVPGLTGARRPQAMLVCALTAAGAFASKEPYIVLPALYLAYALFVAGVPLGKAFAGAAAGLVGLGAVALVRWHLRIPTVGDLPPSSITERLRTFGTLAGVYGGEAVSLSAGPTIRTFAPWSTGAASAVTLAAAGLFFVSLWRWRRGSTTGGRVAFGVTWFAMALAPHVVSIAALGVFANRYGYFPLLGVLFATAGALDGLMAGASVKLRRFLAVAFFLPTAIAAPVSSAMASLWATEIDLFGADFAQNPDDPQLLYFLGCAIERRAGCDPALPYFRRAAALDPALPRASQNLAGCLLRTGKGADAVSPAENAAHLSPTSENLYNLALALEAVGRFDEASSIADALVRGAQPDPEDAAFADLASRLRQERRAKTP